MKISLLGILSENNQISINEVGAKEFVAGFTGNAKSFKSAKPGVFAAFSDVLTFAKKDKNQIVGLTAKSPNKAVIISNVDDLLHALRVEGGMAADVLAKFNQGLLKSSKTPIDLIDGITKEVVGSKNFISNYGKLTDGQMRKALKAAGYSDNAIESFMKNAKKNPQFKNAYKKGIEKRRQLKNNKGGTTILNPNTPNNVSPSQRKTIKEKSTELLNNIKIKNMNWSQLLKWGASLAIGGAAIWWAIYELNDTAPDGIPEQPPVDNQWAPCIQELIKSGEATVKTLSGGIVVAQVKTNEYPEGLNFVSDGRVANIATKQMGSWKCKGGKATINEQDSDAALAQDVDKMIDYLDFPVTYNDLKNAGTLLQNYADKGKGKEFLNLYQQSGLGGGDLGKSLKYIYTSEPKSVQAKQKLTTIYNNILSGKSTETPTTGEKKGLGGIEITWDSNKKSEGGGGGTTPYKPKFRDCSGKPLPHEFGCRSEQIKQVQICLNFPEKYRTGNFGPITKKAIEDMGIDLSNGMTQNVVDRICNQGRGEQIQYVQDREKISTSNLDSTDIKLPLLPNINPSNVSDNEFYNALRNNGNIISQDGNRVKYKGPDLNDLQLSKLDNVLTKLGYVRIKQIEDVKKYGSKYVWLKK